MSDDPQKQLSDEEQIEKVKSAFVVGLIVVVFIAAIVAYVLYSKLSNG